MSRRTPRHLRLSLLDPLAVLLFAVAWCGLWAEISLANVLSGLGIGAALRFALRSETSHRSVRMVPLAQLIALVAVDLVKSTVNVMREVLTPTDHTDEIVVEVAAGPDAADHLLLLTTAITLTPGTAVIEADATTGALVLHLLHAETEPAVALHVAELARLAHQAFPVSRAARPRDEVSI